MADADLWHLPYGTVLGADGRTFPAARLGDRAIDLTPFGVSSLDALLAGGPDVWGELRGRLLDSVGSGVIESVPLAGVTPLLPFTVADYVDFYASRQHATNVGRLFRPGGEPLTPNWEHLPIGYHGRAGTIVVSGTPVRRPSGQYRLADGSVGFGPSGRLDFEAEVAFVVGAGSVQGRPVPASAFPDHVFGVCLLNDWSARDIQSFESVPLGPFLGKSFATSVGAWITPLAALADAWVEPPHRTVPVQDYLAVSGRTGLDLRLSVELNGSVVSRPPFAAMYWTGPQMLAHLTANGASLRTGDVFASGTVSGSFAHERGSMLELSWNGEQPIPTEGGPRRFLHDGDEVVLRASAPSRHGPLELAEVRGRILPATS